MESIEVTPIGVVRSPFTEVAGMPIQPAAAAGIVGSIELRPELVAGLKDLEGFSHIIVLYHFHRVQTVQLSVVPFLDQQQHGVFATRAPTRPNRIGLSVLRLLSVNAQRLEVADVDILDGTPLLDIKPYVPQFDQPQNVRTGWLEKTACAAGQIRSDDRFD